MHAFTASRWAMLALMLSSTGAQDLIVPGAHASLDAPGVGDVPGFMQRFRQQIILDGDLFTARTGQSIHAITFRRDGKDQRAFSGGRARLKVIVSAGGNGPRDAVASFSANHGAASAVVFDGEVQIPASPALTDRNAATWQSPHAVSLTFSTPYAYSGGPICIDIEGEPVTGASAEWWPVDSFTQPGVGSVVKVGQACAPRSSASTSGAWLQIGASVRLIASGQGGSAGLAVLGSRLATPIDLGFLGAPGCLVHVSPDVLLPSVFSVPPQPDMPGDAQIVLPMPWSSSLLGMTVHNQWLNVQRPDARTNPAGITTSNALGLTVSAAHLPPVVATTVRSGLTPVGPIPAHGLVLPGRAPVVQIAFR